MEKYRIYLIESVDELIDSAFRKARKDAGQRQLDRRSDRRRKELEAIKIKISEDVIHEKINKMVTSFPDLEAMHPFYKEMLSLIANVAEVKKALGHIAGINKMMRKFRLETVYAVFRSGNEKEIRVHRKQFYGRAASLLKRAKGSFEIVKKIGKELRYMPKIDFEAPTAILAGYPNTGKTTIMARLTGSKAEVAPYPFTTKNLNIGYFDDKYLRIQIIDSPGILDRPDKEHNVIEKRALSALRHLAHLIIFVVDPTETCGFPLKEQLKLLKETRQKFNVPLVVVANKADAFTEEQLLPLKGEEIIRDGEGLKSELKEILIGKLRETVKKVAIKFGKAEEAET